MSTEVPTGDTRGMHLMTILSNPHDASLDPTLLAYYTADGARISRVYVGDDGDPVARLVTLLRTKRPDTVIASTDVADFASRAVTCANNPRFGHICVSGHTPLKVKTFVTSTALPLAA